MNQRVKSQAVLSQISGSKDCTTSNPLSISAQQSGIIRVPFEVLSQIFQKAGILLSRSKESIVAAPGANAHPQHYVESEHGSPYVVTTKNSKRSGVYYECNGNCIPFATYNLCSHTLAVADLDGNTEAFLHWYKVNKQGSANLSALSQIALPSGRGTGCTQATQIHKGAKNTNKKAKTVVENYTAPRTSTRTRSSSSSTTTSSIPVVTSVSPAVACSTTPPPQLGKTSKALAGSQVETQLPVSSKYV